MNEGNGRSQVLWYFPFEKLKRSADDGQRMLWLEFGADESEQVSICLRYWNLFCCLQWLTAKMKHLSSIFDNRTMWQLSWTYEYYVNCRHMNEMMMWSSQLWFRFTQSQSKPEKCFRGFNGIRTHGKHFSGLLCDCVNRNHNCDDHISISVKLFIVQPGNHNNYLKINLKVS